MNFVYSSPFTVHAAPQAPPPMQQQPGFGGGMGGGLMGMMATGEGVEPIKMQAMG